VADPGVDLNGGVKFAKGGGEVENIESVDG